MVPDDECSTVNFIDLYLKIVNHTLDPLEPFVLPEDKNNSPIRVRIGKSQNAVDFQDVPLTVKVSEAVPLFGLYVKFFVQCEEVPVSLHCVTDTTRNAFQVFFLTCNVRPSLVLENGISL